MYEDNFDALFESIFKAGIDSLFLAEFSVSFDLSIMLNSGLLAIYKCAS